ncbi:MAG: STAS domain-containing protein [Candidatus Omnitrophica bacterium]|jgi:anti-anti-sigma factor|nr:STAS domain-containing protein [Candidatus Omnitrophota bacterium]MDD5654379.1 STAS domain-containing protein [Candidatus Omnitrophota bacterium]
MDDKYSVSCIEGVAKIELIGRLDATNAPALQDELKKLIGQKVSSLVFIAKDLEYISSAGLRVIIFAKQKIGAEASVYFIGAQEGVLSVIKMSGLDTFMTMQDSFDK